MSDEADLRRVMLDLDRLGRSEVWDEAFKRGVKQGRRIAAEEAEQDPLKSPWIAVGDLTDELDALMEALAHSRARTAQFTVISLLGMTVIVMGVIFGVDAWQLVIPMLISAAGGATALNSMPGSQLHRHIREKKLAIKKAQRRAAAEEPTQLN